MTAATPQYITEDELKGWLARWLVGYGVGLLAGAFSLVVWAVRLEARVDRTAERVEEVRIEGSLPVQSLRRDFDSLRIEMRGLATEIRNARQELRGHQ